jgi:hypothetical protein
MNGKLTRKRKYERLDQSDFQGRASEQRWDGQAKQGKRSQAGFIQGTFKSLQKTKISFTSQRLPISDHLQQGRLSIFLLISN